jgi:hypothetical protein
MGFEEGKWIVLDVREAKGDRKVCQRLAWAVRPGRSPYRSTQSVCGDTGDRVAPHQSRSFALSVFSTNALKIAQLRRIGRTGLPFAEARCGMSNLARAKSRWKPWAGCGGPSACAGREHVKGGVAHTR